VAQAIADQIAGLSEVTVWRKGRLQCGARWINNKKGAESRNTAQHGQ
jgi:hypothetical protein